MSDQNNAEKAIDSMPANGGSTLGAQHGIQTEHNSTLQLISLWVVIIALICVLVAVVLGSFVFVSIALGVAVVAGVVYALAEWNFGRSK